MSHADGRRERLNKPRKKRRRRKRRIMDSPFFFFFFLPSLSVCVFPRKKNKKDRKKCTLHLSFSSSRLR